MYDHPIGFITEFIDIFLFEPLSKSLFDAPRRPTPRHLNMSTTAALQARLKELSATLGQIQPLVERLRNFTASIGQEDEARVELGSEIHGRLKDAEEELELLRVEVEALDPGSDSRRKSTVASGEKEAERERVVAMAGRLSEDLKRWVCFAFEYGGRVLISLVGPEEAFEMLNYRPSGMPRLRNEKNVSCCSQGHSRLLSASSHRRRNLHRTIWC